MTLVVAPDRFVYVDFDAAEITAEAERLLSALGLADHAVSIVVDEATPLSRVELRSLDPLQIAVEGGAFEDLRRLRQLDRRRVVDALGLHLFQARDRLDETFGGPEFAEPIALAHQTAWDVYAMGRLARLEADPDHQRQRRLFHFRNRHGFSDAGDAAFARLWWAEILTWSQIVTISDTCSVHSAPKSA